MGSPVASEKTGEGGFLYYFILFCDNCPWKIQRDFVNTWELHTQNWSSSTSTLSVDAMLNFEHESFVLKELWMKILANLIG